MSNGVEQKVRFFVVKVGDRGGDLNPVFTRHTVAVPLGSVPPVHPMCHVAQFKRH